jgi:hypothetical protein
LPCEAGKFAEWEGSADCIKCPVGKFVDYPGSDSPDNCIEQDPEVPFVPESCESFTSCSHTTLNKGGSVSCIGDASTCDEPTCCHAAATCDSFIVPCSDGSFNKGQKVGCAGDETTCDEATCCETRGRETSGTCDDGTMNQDEEGVDCGGGLCGSCPDPTEVLLVPTTYAWAATDVVCLAMGGTVLFIPLPPSLYNPYKVILHVKHPRGKQKGPFPPTARRALRCAGSRHQHHCRSRPAKAPKHETRLVLPFSQLISRLQSI